MSAAAADLAHAVPGELRALCQRIRKHGFAAWIVGGSVRDVMLGREVHDWDLATSATPQQIMKAFPRVVPTGIDHGTVTVLWQGASYEVTTLRGEGEYIDGRRPDRVFFVDSIEADLARRDFTINAIAYCPLEQRLIDPFGGEDDLHKQCIRAVGDAGQRFAEDGLRVLRAARFAATLNMQLDPATYKAIGTTLDTFAKVSCERVRDEWLKTMKATKPSRAFEIMRSTGMLAIICPELLRSVGCTQNHYHGYDVWHHTMHCLDAYESSPEDRLAALFHDIAKPHTRAWSAKTQDYTFYDHEKVGASMADQWLRQYRFANAQRERITSLVRHHLIAYSSEWSDAAVRRFIQRVGEGCLDAQLALAHADHSAKGPDEAADPQADHLRELRERIHQLKQAPCALRVSDLAISGRDLIDELKTKPGRHIGELLRTLLDEVIEEPAHNTRECLLAKAATLLPQEQRDA